MTQTQHRKSSVTEHEAKDGNLLQPVPSSPSRLKWRRISIIVSLIYVNFWMAAAISLQAPFFPREAEAKGATPTVYGLVFGVYELAVVVTSPIFGRIVTKINPKYMITGGVFLGGVACTAFGLIDRIPAGPKYIASAFVVRILEGIGAAALMTASYTTIASEFPSSVGTSFSLMETAFGVGLIVGPTVGGAFYQVGGFMLPFVVSGGFVIFGFVLLCFILPGIDDSEKQQSNRNILEFLLDGGIIMFIISIITSLMFIGFNAATLEPHLRQFNLSSVILGVIFIITGGMYAITTPVWGRLCDKGVNPVYICIMGYALTCGGLLIIGPVPFLRFQETLATVIVSLVILGFGASAKLVSSFIGALYNAERRGFPNNLATYGMLSALFSTSCSIGAFIGPSLGGFLLDTTGYKMGTVVILSLEIFFMLVMIAYAVGRRGKDASVSAAEKEPLLTKSFHRRSLSYTAM